MQKYTEAVVAWLVKYQVIEEQEKELYCYAMESYILFWSPVIFALLLGIIMGKVKESIFVIIPFMIIRKYSGGYHAKHLSVSDMFFTVTAFVHSDCLQHTCQYNINVYYINCMFELDNIQSN